MSSVAPVIIEAAGEQRKTTAAATSGGSPTRPSGMRARRSRAEGLVLQPLHGAGSADERRRDGVDVDAVGRPLDGQTLGQVGDGRLGHAVDRLRRQRHEARLRAEVDDPPAAPAAIMARPTAWLTKKVPLRLTASVASKSVSVTASAGLARADAGVVDQNVEAAEMAHRFGDGGGRPRRAG